MPTRYKATDSRGIEHRILVGHEGGNEDLHGPGIPIQYCVVADRNPRIPEWAGNIEVANKIVQSHATAGLKAEIVPVAAVPIRLVEEQ